MSSITLYHRQFTPSVLLCLQVIAHIAWIPLVLYGAWWQFLVVISVYFLTGCLGMSITYHRLLSHRSWKAPRWLEYLGTFFGSLGLTGTSITWVAIHRQHHRHTDDSKDPHSPHFKGFWGAHFLSMYERPNLYLVKDLVSDKLHNTLHKNYLLINFSVVGLLFLLDPMAVLYAYLCPAAILWNGGSSINSFCHLWGYKNFNLRNKARNNPIFAFLTWGEGWHNNHHKYPSKYTFSHKWYEWDIGGLCIYIFQKFSRS